MEIIKELNRDKRLKRGVIFQGDIPTQHQVYEYFNMYSPEQYNNIANSFFKLFLKTNKRHVSDLIVDATPVQNHSPHISKIQLQN